MSSSNVTWHSSSVSKADRSSMNSLTPAVLWFTGLSGSGKSTIANAVELELHRRGVRTYLLDGDNVRHGLNKDLGFSDEDRIENLRRISEVSKLFVDAGLLVLTAFISPFREDRQRVAEMLPEGEFIEVFIDTPIEVCESRDPKGLYKKVRAGEIANFTGIDSAYEAPTNPDIHVKTNDYSIEECAAQIVDHLQQSNYLS